MLRSRPWRARTALLAGTLLLAGAAGTAPGGAAPVVQVWETTGDRSKLLQRQQDEEFGSGGSAQTVIDVDPTRTYQTVDGFGAAFTDSAASLVAHELDAGARDELMNNLFGDNGIGLSTVRQPLGASDFTTAESGDYTFDDTCCDLGDFSTAHDEAYLLPILRQAKQINPGLKVMGTPWSPPAWMKTNDDVDGGELKTDSHGVFADYLVKTAQAYADAGVPLDHLSIQNEPYHPESGHGSAGYPSMHMAPEQQAAVIGDELGPKLAESGLNTQLLAWDHNWSHPEYPSAVADDPEAAPHVAGAAFHCYEGDVTGQSRFQQDHPDKGIWLTECSGGDWSPDFAQNLKWQTQNLVIGGTRNWAKSVLLWNMALDQNHGPTNGGCSNCRGVVTVNTDTGEVTYNEEYYVLGHVAKFVQPGAQRIESTSKPGGVESVAFRNADGSIALLVLNAADSEQTFQVRSSGQSFERTLPAGAVTTFTWRGA